MGNVPTTLTASMIEEQQRDDDAVEPQEEEPIEVIVYVDQEFASDATEEGIQTYEPQQSRQDRTTQTQKEDKERKESTEPIDELAVFRKRIGRTALLLGLPAAALIFAYISYNNEDHATNEDCNNAAHWMIVLAWSQISLIVFVLLLQLGMLWLIQSDPPDDFQPSMSHNDNPFANVFANIFVSIFGRMLYFMMVVDCLLIVFLVGFCFVGFFQLAWLIYGALLLTQNRDDYNGEEDEGSCMGMAMVPEIYCWICLVGTLVCHCQVWRFAWHYFGEEE